MGHSILSIKVPLDKHETITGLLNTMTLFVNVAVSHKISAIERDSMRQYALIKLHHVAFNITLAWESIHLNILYVRLIFESV